MNQREPYCYLNGTIAPLSRLSLPLNDLGVLRGYGVFDFLRTYQGRPFLLNEHLTRFEQSAKEVGLRLPVSRKEMERIIEALLQKNKFSETNLKLVLTGGPTQNGIVPSGKPNFFILASKAAPPPERCYTHGVALMTYDYQRMLPDVKHLGYLHLVRMQPALHKAHAFELLFTYRGYVLEGATSNIFLVKGKRIVTPKRDVLVGTTRNFVMTLARTAGYQVLEREVKEKELAGADEVFITASNKEVMPVVRIDDRKVAQGKVGPVAKALLERYHERVYEGY